MSHSFTSGRMEGLDTSGCVYATARGQRERERFYLRVKAQQSSLTDARAVVSCQLEPGFTLAGEGAGDIDAAVLAVPVPALIDV